VNIQAAAPRGAGQAILVVEDDEDVRDVATRILTRANYQVVTAATPKDALEICTNPVVHIDALLTDVVMPEMSGIQLAGRVREIRENLPIMLMSGYTAGSLPGGPEPTIDLPLIRKPFSAATLLHQVHDLLR
jgi:DNA-binding NtrC family response regulator